ncbi:cell division protein FtsN [Biostraticola tofi]|uniref:Cell division protein FtsN n=2 Tax=Biostraticola tofi TaxID=466109 RepID=A0A4R3YMC6_9GAMM|nr:cell division protein FtsN [Biostraticola tofi]
MIALAAAVLITFVGGLYFIAHNKTEEAVILPNHGKHTGNGLPPKPEERWRYIKELENRQIGVQTPTEPSAGGEVQSPSQLTDEQRQLLEQMQADMRQQPTHLNEVPYNDKIKAPIGTTQRSQVTQVPESRQPAQQPVPQPRQQSLNPAQQPLNQATQPRQPAQQPLNQATQPRQPAQQPVNQVQQPRQQIQQPAAQQPRQPASMTQAQPQTAPTRNEPKPVAKSETEKKETAQRWLIQCGSFKTMDQAESVRAQLAFAGIESRITSNGGWNRIMLGPYSNRAGADKSLQNLRSAGAANCIPIATGG